MRLRRVEFFALALTLAFASFMTGYFLGSKGSVSIVATPVSQNNHPTQIASVSTNNTQQMGTPDVPNASQATQATPVVPDEFQISAADDLGFDESDDNDAITEFEYAASEIPGSLRGGDGKININTATRAELMDLPGIGEVLAGRIVDYRNRYGNYTRIDDIMRVSGIGEKRFETIMDKITVG